ncbi:hypothetical protein F4860DRAFT_510843 [Xylaria cubensis]|nr:hypothetical protein F4860DRAFT_510843 [Xylaria cubensis]
MWYYRVEAAPSVLVVPREPDFDDDLGDEVLDLQSMFARAIKLSKRRRDGDAAIPTDDLPDDETAVRKRPPTQLPIQLREIRGRTSDGPFDLATRARSRPFVNISLKNLYQHVLNRPRPSDICVLTEKTRVNQGGFAAMKATPNTKSAVDETTIILGLPRLWSVKDLFDIRNNTLIMCGEATDEEAVTAQSSVLGIAAHGRVVSVPQRTTPRDIATR